MRVSDPESPVALVTGASSGIGRAVAARLAEEGFRTFGTSRDPVARPGPAGATTLRMDVRSDDSVAECVAEIERRCGRIDAVVANAGYALSGAVEETTLDEATAHIDTNFLGSVRTIRAALPAMRRQRSGRIVVVSSGLAAARSPFTAFYAAGKCALEGFAEALRHEVAPLGIHVSVVAPGYVRSNIEAAAVQGSLRIPDYEPWRSRTLGVLHHRLQHGKDPSRVAAQVLRLLRSSDPGFYTAVGGDAVGIAVLRRVLPPGVFRRMLRLLFRLEGAVKAAL